MATNFPLHRAIKKILDDPNSRPKIPGLKPEPEPDSDFPLERIGVFPGGWSESAVGSSFKSLQTRGKNTVGISGSPAVAVFKGKLYCVYEGANNRGWLHYSVLDGQEWSEDKPIDGHGISGSPALAVYKDKLYCVYEGKGESGWLHYCTFDGQSWSKDEALNYGTSKRERRYPCASLAVYKGVLCCVHEGQGSKGKGWLWYATFDGEKWSDDKKLPKHSTNGGGSLTVIGDRLYCLYEGNDGSGLMRYTYTEDLSDEKNWSEDKELILSDDDGAELKCKTSGPPGVTTYGDKSYWVHEGSGNDGVVWSFNNKDLIDKAMLLDEPAPERPLRTSGPPAVANYDNKFYILRQGPENNGELLVATQGVPETEDGGTATFCEDTGLTESSNQELEKRNSGDRRGTPDNVCFLIHLLYIYLCWFDGAPHERRLNNTDYGRIRIGLEEPPAASGSNFGRRPAIVEGVVMPVPVGRRDQTPQPIAGWSDRWNEADIDRGHLFALNLGGPDEPQNIVPQWARWQRLEDWRAMERTVRARAVQEIDDSRPFGGGSPERSVFFRVEVIYPRANQYTLRSWAFPSRFRVTAYVCDRQTGNELPGVRRIYDNEEFEGYPDNWSPS
ncbi:MAG: DNA/RNA non-specific endonuclease [Chroococcidiopsis sp.]